METKKQTSSSTSSTLEKSDTNKNRATKASMKSSQLMKLFENELKDIYWAEKALVKSLPKMKKNATSEDLSEAISAHLEETKEHVTRLERVFSLLGKKATAKKCDAMEGLLEEGTEIMESCEEGAMRDAGIIAAAQKVEHYEIATYGTLRQFAETLKLSEVEELLSKTLEEEKNADLKLSEVAMDAINVDASEEKA
ncbi:ferritin-like domain-containing protein [Algoriphagus jejuensis]|uniref:Ferritin-like domain-containing protein n=1 Tax=Algoriphagus jejuensis TaxID=419934 RepID=A0ABN1MY20_9BACT